MFGNVQMGIHMEFLHSIIQLLKPNL